MTVVAALQLGACSPERILGFEDQNVVAARHSPDVSDHYVSPDISS